MREGKLHIAIRRRQMQPLVIFIALLAFSLVLVIDVWRSYDPGISSFFDRFLLTIPAILSAFFFAKTLIPCLFPDKYKRVRKLGYGQDSKKLLAVIAWQYDCTEKANIVQISGAKRIHMAKNWLVLETRWKMDFFLADDLLWAYKKQATTRSFLTNADRYDQFIVLHSRHRSISTYGKGVLIENALKEIQRIYPWVITGYSQDRKNAWQSDFAKLSAVADKAKTQARYESFSLDREYSRYVEWMETRNM